MKIKFIQFLIILSCTVMYSNINVSKDKQNVFVNRLDIYFEDLTLSYSELVYFRDEIDKCLIKNSIFKKNVEIGYDSATIVFEFVKIENVEIIEKIKSAIFDVLFKEYKSVSSLPDKLNYGIIELHVSGKNRQEKININNLSSQLNFTELNKIPVNQLTKEQCFEILDKMVKDCNGKKMSSKNYIQYKSSFTPEGYAFLTDEKRYSQDDIIFYVYRNIQWETLLSVNTRQLNFQYSCICVDFPNGYYPYHQVARTTLHSNREILNNDNPIKLNEDLFPYEYIENPYKSNHGFTIYVKNQDANKFVELIKRISLIEREKNKNMVVKLNSKEKWGSNGHLIKWNEDSKGNFQGRYEEYDNNGKLLTFGNFRNNVRDGKWVVDGITKVYPLFLNDCMCSD